MSIAQRSKDATRPSARQSSGLTMFTLKAGAVKSLAGREWPADAEFAIVSKKAETAKRIRDVVGDKVTRVTQVTATGQGTEKTGDKFVQTTAFEPDARSKALLRGVRIAEDDLASAGGAFDLDQIRTLMRGVSRQAIDKRVQEGSLLAVPGPSNRRRYPTLQFDADGLVVAGLRQVQEALPTQNPWVVLNFLARPDARLGGKKPIDMLKADKIDLVVQAARHYGEQGA